MLSIHHKDDFASYGGNFYWFHGVVEDVSDPLQMGRVRVRCVGYHTDNLAALPTSGLPWALCLLPITSPSMAGIGQSATGIQQGSWVIGFFRDGPSAQDPIVLGTIASKSSSKADSTKGFSDPSGVNPQALGFDIPSEATSSSLTVAAKSAFAGSFIDLSYIAPSYPNNQVIKTRSGHVIEYDDTKNHERISLFHKDGGFVELAPNGVINIAGSKINLAATTINQNIRSGTVVLTYTGSSSDIAGTVVFTTPMPSANYVVVAGSLTQTDAWLPRFADLSPTGFNVYTDWNGQNGTYYWAAIQIT